MRRTSAWQGRRTAACRRHDHVRRRGAGVHAHAGHPDRRVRLLDRPRPDIHRAILEKFAFPGERAVMRGQRLQDQVVRLPVAAHQAAGVGVGGVDLIRRALDQAHLQPATRQAVEPSHFFRDTDRIGAVGDRVAKRQQAGSLRFARDNGKRHRHRDGHAGGGAVVLVHHDVDADLIAQGEFVKIAVQQFAGLGGIEVVVREIHRREPRLARCQPGDRPFRRNTRCACGTPDLFSVIAFGLWPLANTRARAGR